MNILQTISVRKTSIRIFLICAVYFFFMLSPVYAQGDAAMTFTVTPPLFQLNLVPGEVWTSGIQVVNGNPYDITIYAEPILFEPEGESGRPYFLNVGTEGGVADLSTLAGWITVPPGGRTIAREQTHIIPITISVPEDASPGGHYAAVLIGNRPSIDGREDGAVSVTSSIASLIFLRVAGDVIEDGRIRDFTTEQAVYEDAEARLSLRFENQGNVHLQPQGDITIYNMFNKKRGYIPINQARGYGNVLPESIRKFTFLWESDSGSWDIGRYRAEATLGYGFEAKSFAQATTYFWVLPVVPLLQVLVGLVTLVWFMGWALRAYVRRALALESDRIAEVVPLATQQDTKTQHIPNKDAPLHMSEASTSTTPEPRAQASTVQQPALRLGALMRPIEEGMVDLRRAGGTLGTQSTVTREHMESKNYEQKLGMVAFIRQYRAFFIFLAVLVAGILAVAAFFADVTTQDRTFTAVEERPDGTHVELPVPMP